MLLGSALLGFAGTASADPMIVGDASNARCREAFEMATAAFRSTNPSLHWPIAEPSQGSRIVLRQSQEDISGGQAILADQEQFAALRQSLHGGYTVTTLWGRKPSAGKRLAIVDAPHGWRGDWYKVYLLDPDMTPELLATQMTFEMADGETRLKPVLGDNRWNPPIILLDTATDGYWVIDRGEPYDAMADWRIHLLTADGLTTPCVISFGHSERTGLAGMPPAVRRLAAALDEALGPENDIGTLQPKARIRLDVEKGWANAALRPWSFTREPYNTRPQVLHGLAEWSRGNKRRASLRRRIELSYPAAERALAAYYAARFRGQPGSAQDLSRHVLDQMFRRYFVFPGGALG